MDSNEEKIKVECNKITKDGTLQCDITTQDLTKMNRLGIKPENIQFNVKDKISIPKSTQETKSIDETKPTEADSSNKQGCGCSKTTENEIANFVAKYLLKKEEN